MKFMAIGLGQAGGRIADELVRLDERAGKTRRLKILTGAFAVDTDASSLRGLSSIKVDQRMVLGEAKTLGRGVGKDSLLGAQIAEEEGFKIVDSVRQTKRFAETDFFLLAGGVGGGTASGILPVVARLLKERYPDKTVYVIAVLPFEHEESIEPIFAKNAASGLKSIQPAADAVFLIDNERFVRKGISWQDNINEINQKIVEPFFNLLCSGEEKKAKHVGVSTLEVSDIIKTLSGWTAIGYGKTDLALITLPWDKSKDETQKGAKALEEAISELSIACNPSDASGALYLVSAPPDEIGISLIKYLGEYLRNIAPNATIRYGDYPYGKGYIDITVVLSGLKTVEKVNSYFARSPS
ncbi:MAG: cell division protein FtsZ [Dehalococcoidia bacterium]|nr:MAG: cell division protein FtsZ [Dehalococcoidia bacterium]